MRLLGLLIVAWLVIGAVAAGQRHYFEGPVTGCSRLETIAKTIAGGPLNYVGMDPKASCTMPRPSK